MQKTTKKLLLKVVINKQHQQFFCEFPPTFDSVKFDGRPEAQHELWHDV